MLLWLVTITLLNCIFHVHCLLLFTLCFSDDHIAIGADCDELGAQIEENILNIEWKVCLEAVCTDLAKAFGI